MTSPPPSTACPPSAGTPSSPCSPTLPRAPLARRVSQATMWVRTATGPAAAARASLAMPRLPSHRTALQLGGGRAPPDRRAAPRGGNQSGP
eukprot:2216518-Alexandrium_andersonii.AAC.1